MPQYDYKCEHCDHRFTVTLSMADREEKDRKHEIRCPTCDSQDVKHLAEAFYAVTSKKS